MEFVLGITSCCFAYSICKIIDKCNKNRYCIRLINNKLNTIETNDSNKLFYLLKLKLNKEIQDYKFDKINNCENELEYKEKILEINNELNQSRNHIKELEKKLFNLVVLNKKDINNDLKKYFYDKKLKTYVIEDFPIIDSDESKKEQ